MVTIATLAALGTEPQLKLHINTGFTVGLTKGKIVRGVDGQTIQDKWRDGVDT